MVDIKFNVPPYVDKAADYINDLRKKKLAMEKEFEYVEIDCKKSEF